MADDLVRPLLGNPDLYLNVNHYLSRALWAITALVVVVLYWPLVDAVVLLFRRKPIFQMSQNTSRFMELSVLSCIDLMAIAVLGYLDYNAFTNPAIGPSAGSARLIILGVVLVPMGIYSVSYYHQRNRRFNLGLLSAELPPE